MGGANNQAMGGGRNLFTSLGSGGGTWAGTLSAHSDKGCLGRSGGLRGVNLGDLLGSSGRGPDTWWRTKRGLRSHPRRAQL
jgi:hypothetical protein